MKHYLVVVDMQKDFVDGALGTAEAAAIVPNAAEKIRAFDGRIFATFDTHFENYLDTAEGKKLPVTHCVLGTDGWELDKTIAEEDACKMEHVISAETAAKITKFLKKNKPTKTRGRK